MAPLYPAQKSDSIYVCTHRAFGSTIGLLLECFPCKARERIKLLSYGQLFRIREFPPGAFVFTDFDRLSAADLGRVRVFARYLAQSRPGFPILNHPDRVLGRFDLLNELPKRGMGETAAHRIQDWSSVEAFPVFIRRERGHHGDPVTGLIRSRDELEATIKGLFPHPSEAPDDFIIVRYLDYADSAGVFRKYGAFRVGGQIYGEHLFHSSRWYLKDTGRETNDAFQREARDYYRSNPHAERLQAYFDAAGIDFGRADYCLLDGEINIFEINTNPTFVSAPPSKRDAFDRHEFAGMHDRALMSIPAAVGDPLRMPAELHLGGSTLSPHSAHLQTMRLRVRPDVWSRLLEQRIAAVTGTVREWVAHARSG